MHRFILCNRHSNVPIYLTRCLHSTVWKGFAENWLKFLAAGKMHEYNKSKSYRMLSDDHDSRCFTLFARCKLSPWWNGSAWGWSSLQLRNHPHQLDLQFYRLIIQVKTAESGYDPGRERDREQRFEWRLDVWRRGNKASNNPIMWMWTVFLNAWFQSGDYYQGSERVIGWALTRTTAKKQHSFHRQFVYPPSMFNLLTCCYIQMSDDCSFHAQNAAHSALQMKTEES